MALEVCNRRQDEWSVTVNGRIQYAQDLHAKRCPYTHHDCSVNFRIDKQIPRVHTSRKRGKPPRADRAGKRGRRSNDDRDAVFLRVVDYLEQNDEEQTTINDLINTMEDFLEGTGYEPYSFKYMKVRLQDHFGDRILITEINGRSNVVTFRTTAAHILHEYCFDAKRGDEEAEKNRVTVTAAKLIKSEIKSLETNKQTYPSEADMESVGKGIEYLPATLKLFLQELFVGKDTDRKVASIGQAIMQCVRPRVIIAPLQIGLAVQMHRQFGSRFIVDSLNSHGFCSSYTEVQAYERSATVHQGTDISGFQSTSFMQHVADNVDHNLRTLDGFDTFHGMGIIAAVTPACRSTTAIPKVKVTSEDIAAVGKLDIRFYRRPCKESTALTYKALPAFVVDDDTYNADLLWKTAWLLHPHRQSWNGYMQTVHSGNHPGVSSIVFMPMIDMKSNDESCLYSTMHFVCAQSRRYGVTPILTFDQPLWWKSVEIQNAEASDSVLKKLVLRLGGLHTEMSFLGCIGHLMGGSGLHEVAGNNFMQRVQWGHMLSGKQLPGQRGGHILVESVLTAMLLSKLYDSPLPGHESDSDRDSDPELVVDETDPQSVSETGRVQSGEIDPELMGDTGRDMVGDIDHEPLGETDAGPHDELGNDTGTAAGDHSDQVKADAVNRENGSAFEETTDTCVDVSDLEKAGYLFISLEKGDISLEDVRVNNLLTKLHDRLVQYKADLETYRTSKLWLQYLEMTELLRRFIKAERMGNWDLHLKTLSDMLPYFAASGHNLYTKSAYLYLQNMSTLEQDHPDVFQYFQNGYHVIRRTDRYWAGISTDLAIEQVLMRSVKTSGGLTRGRGMSEIQRAVWLLSTPACAEINRAMQEFTGVTYIASEQHKDSSPARIDRDHRDMLQLLQFLEPRSPFTEDDVLCSITNGVTADETVNVDQAQMVGTSVINALAGQEVHAFSFKKKDKAVTLLTKLSVKCDNEDVHVDPQLLFQRLVSSAARGTVSGDELEQLFTYELCTHPPALFTMDGLLREANKPPLADAIEHAVGHTPCEIPSPVKYVLDGGSCCIAFLGKEVFHIMDCAPCTSTMSFTNMEPVLP